MIKRISKTQDIKTKMRSAGKASYLDQPKHVAAIVEMNEQLMATRREYQVKDKNSQITAATVILNS